MARYDPNVHHRRSIRLPGYDYSRPGAYFVTICTRDRVCWLGDIVDETVALTDAGRIVHEECTRLPERFPTVHPDTWIVMPNHLHAIILLGAHSAESPGADAIRSLGQPDATQPRPSQWLGAPGCPDRALTSAANRSTAQLPVLGEVVRVLKAVSARRIRTETSGEFAWQPNFYEHIVRGEGELSMIREYVTTNPLRWTLDRVHPDHLLSSSGTSLPGAGPPAGPGNGR
jgi:putative transposase